jgi:hypothetical protein
MAALEKFVRAQRVRQLPVLPGDQQNAAHPQFAPPPFLLRELLYATAFLLALLRAFASQNLQSMRTRGRIGRRPRPVTDAQRSRRAGADVPFTIFM